MVEAKAKAKYSKFKGLEYNKNDDFCSFWEKRTNYYFKEILENSTLIAKKFGELNDVDECSYDFENLKKQDIENIYSMKNKKVICAFTISNNNNDLMWAHYANGSLGVKIDFNIDKEFKKYIKKVKYKPNKPNVNSINELEKQIVEIMCRKNKDWKYEKECRAIFDNDEEKLKKYVSDKNHFFPIDIIEITLGRKFCLSENSRIYEPDLEENRKFDKNVIEVAKFIYRVLKNNKKYSLKMPTISAYKTKYSPKSMEITKEELEN